MKKVDITDLLISSGFDSGAFKVRWKMENGLKYSDLVVFDDSLCYFVWYDDYLTCEDRSIIYCEEVLSIEKFKGKLL